MENVPWDLAPAALAVVKLLQAVLVTLLKRRNRRHADRLPASCRRCRRRYYAPRNGR